MRSLLPLAAVFAFVALPAATQTDSADFHSDPKFQKALASAKAPVAPLADRYSAWQKANKIAGGKCIECMQQMIRLDQSLGQWKEMAVTGTALDATATQAAIKFQGLSAEGTALMHYNNGKPKKADLEAANDVLTRALQLAPDDLASNYQRGRALAMLGDDAEAKAVFQHYLDVDKGRDPYRTRVMHFAENPHLATLSMAPAFTIRTTDGQEFTLDALAGKVVLLDFWASWCGPCRETLPRVRDLAKKFAGQPFVVLSISIDNNDEAWRKAMQKEAMTWPQYRDADGRLANAYGAHSIPRFFTIDSDGALQDVQVGSDASIEGEIRKLVKRASAAQATAQPAATAGQ